MLLKPLFNGILSLFNVGLYLSDSVDSLIQKLAFVGLENQANKIVHLYELMEDQNQLMLILDSFRTFLMLLSLIFIFIINYQLFEHSFDWMKRKSKNAYFFIKTKLKTKFRKWLM